MSQSRQQKRTMRRRGSARSSSEDRSGLLTLLLQMFIAALLVGRLLMPAESAAQGDTLWLVQLWLAAGLLWMWNCLRERNDRVRLNWFDLALWSIVAGHVVSALWIVYTGNGQRRAAMNMLWEWIGLGVSFFLIRQTIRTSFEKRALVTVLLLTTVSLAGLGVWQHYIFYPQAARQYQDQREELDRLIGAVPGGNSELAGRLQRIREIQREFSRQDIPLEGPSRMLWEERLRSSTEPFGLFALANTFAGLLIVWLIVGLATLGRLWRISASRSQLIGVVLAVGLMAFCLLLTKSRTAWVGLGVGVLTWTGLRIRRRETPVPAWLETVLQLGGGWGRSAAQPPDVANAGGSRWSTPATPRREGVLKLLLIRAGLGVVVLVVFVSVAWLSGGMDIQVVSEAPKSLQYRFQFWTGAWKVIRENPWLGAGPGNFRQHYLKHKLPESSEEIADPHNMLLDLWSNGGLLAVVGLAACLWVAMRWWKRPGPDDSQSRSADVLAMSRLNPMSMGAGLSFILVYVFGTFLGTGPDDRLMVLLAGWVILLLFVGRALLSVEISNACFAAATVALLVHLLGAGGIEMPAIAQTLLIFPALACTFANETDNGAKTERVRPWVFLFGAAMPILFVGCLFSATGPVLNRKALMTAGDVAWIEESDLLKAGVHYKAAAERDPLSSDPPRRLAELAFHRWRSAVVDSADEFELVENLGKLMIEQDPLSPFGYRTLGGWYRERFRRTHDKQHAKAAVGYLQRAVERYPNQAVFRAELADALVRSGKTRQAREQAERSLELDAINHREGHRDKFLPPPIVESLQGMLEGSHEKRTSPNRN